MLSGYLFAREFRCKGPQEIHGLLNRPVQEGRAIGIGENLRPGVGCDAARSLGVQSFPLQRLANARLNSCLLRKQFIKTLLVHPLVTCIKVKLDTSFLSPGEADVNVGGFRFPPVEGSKDHPASALWRNIAQRKTRFV